MFVLPSSRAEIFIFLYLKKVVPEPKPISIGVSVTPHQTGFTSRIHSRGPRLGWLHELLKLPTSSRLVPPITPLQCVRGSTLAEPTTMQPSDAPSFLSTTPAEGSFEPRQQESEELGGAASSPSPSPSRATRAGGETGGVRCQECRHRRAKAYCPHCRSCRGAVCPGHVKTTSHVPASQCSEGQQATLAASASAAAVDVEPIPNKRPRWTALPSAATAAAAAPTATSSGTRRIPSPPRRIVGLSSSSR
jgi:hypothetical protein